MNTPALSRSACATASGISRRRRRYKSVTKRVCGTGESQPEDHVRCGRV